MWKGISQGILVSYLTSLVPSSSSWLYGLLSLSFFISSCKMKNAVLSWYGTQSILLKPVSEDFHLCFLFHLMRVGSIATLIAVKNLCFCLNFFLFSEAVSFVGLLLGFLFVLSDWVSRWYMIITEIFFNWQTKDHNLCPIQTSYMLSGRRMFYVEIIWSWKGWLNIQNLKHGHNSSINHADN